MVRAKRYNLTRNASLTIVPWIERETLQPTLYLGSRFARCAGNFADVAPVLLEPTNQASAQFQVSGRKLL